MNDKSLNKHKYQKPQFLILVADILWLNIAGHRHSSFQQWYQEHTPCTYVYDEQPRFHLQQVTVGPVPSCMNIEQQSDDQLSSSQTGEIDKVRRLNKANARKIPNKHYYPLVW